MHSDQSGQHHSWNVLARHQILIRENAQFMTSNNKNKIKDRKCFIYQLNCDKLQNSLKKTGFPGQVLHLFTVCFPIFCCLQTFHYYLPALFNLEILSSLFTISSNFTDDMHKITTNTWHNTTNKFLSTSNLKSCKFPHCTYLLCKQYACFQLICRTCTKGFS